MRGKGLLNAIVNDSEIAPLLGTFVWPWKTGIIGQAHPWEYRSIYTPLVLTEEQYSIVYPLLLKHYEILNVKFVIF